MAKHPGGRPTKYREEYCDGVDEYLKTCVDKETEFHKTRGEKSDSYDRILEVNLPMIEGYGRFINVPEKTLYSWANVHDEFRQALDRIKEAQKIILLKKGLSGEYNTMIAKLMLSHNHGMYDKQALTNGQDKDGNDIPIQNVIVIKSFNAPDS